jgi:lysophospholipase L1-like esterase
MKLFCYGDSWTEGQGCDSIKEYAIKDRLLLQEFRNQYSWPKYLSLKLKCSFENKGYSGRANNLIFNDVISDLRNGNIHKGDLVVIMWSSSLRDYVHFLPKGEWISWSSDELKLLPQKFIESYKFGDEKYNNFLSNYKGFFLENMFNQNYYNIINQNYIIFLQKILEEYNVKYLMSDAFDFMVQSPNKEDDITHLINKKNYWNFGTQTIKDYLSNTNDLSIWELVNTPAEDISKHPNAKGYNIISDLLYNYLKINVL